VAGSATLVHSLIENDLVDALRPMVFPVMIGGGKRPFPESQQKKRFKLTDTQTSARASPSTHTSRPEPERAQRASGARAWVGAR
jgi:dihydrofolate reductase